MWGWGGGDVGMGWRRCGGGVEVMWGWGGGDVGMGWR